MSTNLENVVVQPSTAVGLDAWRGLAAAQQPEYADGDDLARVVAALRSMPPLVFAGEADELRERLAAASRGEAFVLQGGLVGRLNQKFGEQRLIFGSLLLLAVSLLALPLMQAAAALAAELPEKPKPPETEQGAPETEQGAPETEDKAPETEQ